ncbi:hypothetical protein ACIQEY_11515 [Streptomyces parvus]|uniref:hypothetical protein n=1 Tax=Streptomyces parvus TaxID=66428 RepID=UPI0037F7B9AB
MRIATASAAATFCATALALTFGTAGAVTPADGAPAEQAGGKPACGSVESYRLGAPYSGNINRNGNEMPVHLTPGAEQHRIGRISTGPVTGPATTPDGKTFTIENEWTALDDMITKAVANYQVRDADGEEVGKVTCDPATGAVTGVVAHDIDATFGGHELQTCESSICSGGSGAHSWTPERIDRHIVGTLTLTSDQTAN